MRQSELRKRLAQLNRTALKGPRSPGGTGSQPAKVTGGTGFQPVKEPGATGSQPVESADDPQTADELRTFLVPDPPGGVREGPMRIEEIAPGRAVEQATGGVFWLIERRLRELAPEFERMVRRYGDLLTSEAILVPERASHHMAAFVECDPRRVVYLDIETTGLSGQPLFLVGTMEFDGDDFIFRQFFARDYAEEQHLIAALADHLAAFDMLVTFNGKSFDVPYMRDRAAVCRLELAVPPQHFDLLHESRRRWRREVPNCKLVTLEEIFCRRRRVDDVPGAEIPAAYHDFVHTADASKMRHVLHHNALDLLTMAELALVMLTGQNDWGPH